ncbi:hypothetical protein GF068_16095 [Polyangium spumosum]|uniref:Uncharacterized protein n=1 Tax=Polyangium spumosum TaxID=889282 RepID=A0A6N7PX77_9BACT|nr:hypothetical protein [Polyangium spumosum]
MSISEGELLGVTMSAIFGLETVLLRPSDQLGEPPGADLPSGGVTAVLVGPIVIVAAPLVPAASPFGILSPVLRVVNRERPRRGFRHVKPIDVGTSPSLKGSMCLGIVAVKDIDHLVFSRLQSEQTQNTAAVDLLLSICPMSSPACSCMS